MCEKCVEEGRMTQEQLDMSTFLKAMTQPAKSPAEIATEHMDEAVKLMLEFVKIKRETAATAGGTSWQEALSDPRTLDAFVEMLAGEAMFKMDASTIAYALMLVTMRYADVLDQWATMYVGAVTDLDDLVTDLDQAKTPESKIAFATKAHEDKASTVRVPGLYL